MARRETGLLQQLLGLLWITLLCLSAGFCIAEVKQPLLLITGEFLIRTGLFGTGLQARTNYIIKNCSSTLYSALNTARDSSAQREEETTPQGTVVWTATTNALAETNFYSEPLGMGRH
jgi:hypothetical protein